MRAFVAIDFGRPMQAAVADLLKRLKEVCPRLKWVRPEQMHLTLKFLGEISDEQAAAVSVALASVAAASQAFELTLEWLGMFPPAGRVNVLWVGVGDADERLAACQRECESQLEALGFEREARAFSAHLTLARNNDPRISRQVRDGVRQIGAVNLGTERIDHLTLYQSILGREGPSYRAISRHVLSG